MTRYIVRRVLQALLTFSAIVFLLHYLMSLSVQVRGNPALVFFGDRTPTPEALAQVERLYNLDSPCYDRVGDPCLVPFVERLQNYMAGDFGTTLRGNRDVGELLAIVIPNTLRLFLFSTITLVVLALVLGSWAARHHGKLIDHSVRGWTIFIDSIPVFLLMVIYSILIAVPLTNWARSIWDTDSFMGQLFRPTYSTDHPWISLIIPGILLGTAGLAPMTRLVRASQLENYRADYVRTAHAKGFKRMRVTVVHIVRNSLIPVITAIGFLFADILGGAVVTEGILQIPGMGGLLWDSVMALEINVVLTSFMVIAVVVLTVNLLVDLTYAVLDPRIRYE
ncbi:ABC transporter permease [Glycomyces halotolerans]